MHRAIDGTIEYGYSQFLASIYGLVYSIRPLNIRPQSEFQISIFIAVKRLLLLLKSDV